MVVPSHVATTLTRQQQPGAVRAVEAIGHFLTSFIADVGGIVALGADVVRWAARRPYRLANLLFQLDFVGVGSIFIVSLTAKQDMEAYEL